MAGEIDCPPRRRLEGMARSTELTLERLEAAAAEDGCSYPRSQTDSAARGSHPYRGLLNEIPAQEGEDATPPAEILLLPAGEIELADGRGSWFLKDAAGVVAASPPEIVFDFDHASGTGGSSAAAGWGKLSAREGAVWASMSWTPDGEEALRERRYRYVSPEIRLTRKTGEIKQVLAAGLVNRPAMTFHMERALASAEHSDELAAALAVRLGLPADAGVAEIAAHLDDDRRSQARALGLEEDAGAAEIAAARAALAAAGMDESAAADRAVGAAIAQGRVTPAQRGAALSLALAAPAAFAEFIGGAGSAMGYLSEAVAPAGRLEPSAGPGVKEVAAKLRVDPDAILAERNKRRTEKR